MVSRQNLIKCCYLSAFLDLLAVGMILPLFNRRGKELGASPSSLGLIGSIYGGLQFFSSPYMGKASDTWGRKPVLLLSFLGCIVGYFIMGLADSIFLFALSRLPTGLLKHSQMTVKAYLSDITLPEERAGVLGRFNAVGSLGFIIAPIIGGTLAMQENGFFKVSLLSCSVYMFGVAFVWFVFENKKTKKAKETKLSEEAEEFEIVDKSYQLGGNIIRRKNLDTQTGNLELVSKKQDENSSPSSNFFSFLKIDSIQNILDLLLIRFIMSFSMLIYRTNFTSMLDYGFGIDAKNTGYIISYGSIAGAISGMSVGIIYSYVMDDAKLQLFSALLMTSSLFGIAISPSINLILICMAPLSLSTAVMRANSHNLLLKHILPEEKGAVMGFGDSMTSIARMLSPAIAGFAQEVSATGPCWLATGFAVTGVLLMLGFRRWHQAIAKEKKTN